MQTELKKITPKLAEEILKGNVKNRNLSERTLYKYVADMKNGDWKSNGESIKISDDGQLLDGQHRLRAIVLSGITIEMVIVRGVDPSVVDTIDIGKKRSFSDWLGIKGEKNVTLLASGLVALDNYSDYWSADNYVGNTGGKDKNFGDLEALLELHPLMRISAGKCSSMDCNRFFKPSIICLAHYLFAQACPYMVDDFFGRLSSGANLDDGHPILTLRNMAMRWTSYNQKPANYTMLAYLIYAWNAFIKGRQIKTIRFNEQDPFPVPQKKK